MKYIDEAGRVFYPYYMLEDINAGLYYRQSTTEKKIKKCIEIFNDQELFWDIMCQMRLDWPLCFEYNLSNKTHNRKAWLGQASCCYQEKIPFNVTIEAWNNLQPETQVLANNTAQKMINLFEEENYGKNIFKEKCFGSCDRTYQMDF